MSPSLDEIERALKRLYLAQAGLRKEDLKKARELQAFLPELSRARGGLLVDAAAGHGYLGLLAVELLGISRVVLLERDEARVLRCREAVSHLGGAAEIEVRQRDVGDGSSWPRAPDVVAALHACGPAADEILDGAIASRARWILLVPCCYSHALRFATTTETRADAIGLPRQAAVRRQFFESMIDGERTLRLEAAGYETQVVEFVRKAVTPHNRLFRARRVGEPRRMEEAAERLRKLRR